MKSVLTALSVGIGASALYWLFALISGTSPDIALRTYLVVGIFAGLGSYIGNLILNNTQ